jgi:dipeptidyl aminopeptidase/acylaminoacyl peptidase
MYIFYGALLSLFLCFSAAAATPTIDQLIEIQRVGAPKLSPDGRRVVYLQKRADWEANEFERDLWVADITTGTRHRLTVMDKSNNFAAAWSPDGRWIAFISDRRSVLPQSPAGRNQMWVMPADGGEAQQLTRFEKGVNQFQWAPDSRHIAASATEPDDKARKDREESFGEYRVFHADYEMVRLYLLTLPMPNNFGRMPAVETPKPLTAHAAFSVKDFVFSPDGGSLALSAWRTPEYLSEGTSRLYTIDLNSGQITQVVHGAAPTYDPQWSPDGRQIAFVTVEDYPYGNKIIAVVGREGGASRVLTSKFDEDAYLIRWGVNGLYFEAQIKTQSGLFLADPKTGAVRPIAIPGADYVDSISFSQDLSHAAFVGAGPNRFPEIYYSGLSHPTAVQLTHAGDQFAELDMAQREVIQWKSSDGTVIEGVLEKPKDFDPRKSHPLLVVLHGGPVSINVPTIAPNDNGSDRHYPVDRFVARGALVLLPNFRGGAGYGAKFRALNVRNLGVGEYPDIISGIDALIEEGFVDKERIGVMGWSYGGYLSAFITTTSNRFKAVAVGTGISDWMLEHVLRDDGPLFSLQYLGATPWDDPAIYAKSSPIAHLSTAATPTLIQHGSASSNVVPFANALQLRQGLEDKGVPVTLVSYDGFGHDINKPKQLRALMEQNEAWFAHYIWGEPLPSELTPSPSKIKHDEN